MNADGHGTGRGLVLAAAILVAAATVATPAYGQAGGDGYLFKTPVVTLGMKAGYAVPRAGSEIFAFTRDELTIERSDFNSATLVGDISVRVSERVDLTLQAGFSKSETRSEFREWVDQDDLPIEQVTSFHRLPLTLGVKAYLRDRGRSIGRFAWVPTDWNAYAGAAGGFTWYEFEQVGDFVDFETLDIFPDRFYSDGRAPTLQLFGGFEYALNPTFLLTAEGRYGWAEAEMGRDFVGFDAMDLAGFQATAGISARF
ncbi:MAG: hypothetical protein RH859_13625 [Longimicrobiales bacterium]